MRSRASAFPAWQGFSDPTRELCSHVSGIRREKGRSPWRSQLASSRRQQRRRRSVCCRTASSFFPSQTALCFFRRGCSSVPVVCLSRRSQTRYAVSAHWHRLRLFCSCSTCLRNDRRNYSIRNTGNNTCSVNCFSTSDRCLDLAHRRDCTADIWNNILRLSEEKNADVHASERQHPAGLYPHSVYSRFSETNDIYSV